MSREKKAKPKTAEDLVYLFHPAFAEERKKQVIRRLEKPFKRRSIAVQLALFAVILLLWEVPLANPIKLLVVLFHEMSHAAVAYMTGGVVLGMAIDPGGAGVTLGMGGNEILIASAGYVGSLMFGYLLYYLIAAWEPREVWAVLSFACAASLTVGWLNQFTALFGIGALLLMFLGFFVLRAEDKKFVLRLVATTCCLYPVIDLVGEIFANEAQGFIVRGEVAGSDISRLAAMTGIPEAWIAGPWVIGGLLLVCYLVRWSACKDAATGVKRSLLRRRKPREYWKYNPDDPSTIPHYVID